MEGDNRVKVFVRSRPALGSERGRRAFPLDAQPLAFDSVFAADTTQEDVFTQVGLPVLKECLKGVNGTILAYGQTGSGKTHSLLHQGADVAEAGLLPRLVATLYTQISQDAENVYDIDAAAMQVYNEQVDDLLQHDLESGVGLGLPVQNGGWVPGLTHIKCANPSDLLEAFGRARSNLVYAETRMNKASSRSHAVFQICITRRARLCSSASSKAGCGQQMQCTFGKLNVVDLAGSERVKKSGVEGAQLREATAINRSLLAFGNVVSALAAKRPHVPYRDSKLTRILDGSIGGNSKTALLVCVSPLLEHAAETLSALELATRAMRVEVDARVNVSTVEVSNKAMQRDLEVLAEQACAQELADLRAARAEAEDQWQQEKLRCETMEQQSESLRKLVEDESTRANAAETSAQELQAECEQLRAEVLRLQTERDEWKQHAKSSIQMVEQARLAAEDARTFAASLLESRAAAASEELREALRQRDEALEQVRLMEEAKEAELEELAAEIEASSAKEAEMQIQQEQMLREWQEKVIQANHRAEAMRSEIARAFEARSGRQRSRRKAHTAQAEKMTRHSIAACCAGGHMVEVR